ncbi:unnamed protein product [Ectocarpus sp. 6 AP-2014]
MAAEAAASSGADHGAGHGHGGGGGGGHGGDGGYETPNAGYLWLGLCFLGIMCSFIVYGIVMEYATSGGRELHELSMIFLTSLMYSVTAWYGRRMNGEEPTTIPRTQMLVLGMTSMGSTFTSVRSLRYVIYPVQVLGKSCKPIPVMLMGAFLGKKYPLKKYLNVALIVAGVALFMQSGSGAGKPGGSSGGQLFGLTLLFMSLCFDGGTGAYEDKLMNKHHVGPFDLMFNIQFAKMLLAGLGLVVTGQITGFFNMVHSTGPVLLLLGLSGAMGQVFIFVTISKFGALTCSIIGLARKIVTLLASILIYGHKVNLMQFVGLAIAVGAMVFNFLDKGKKKGGGGHGHGGRSHPSEDTEASKPVELQSLLEHEDEGASDEEEGGTTATTTTASTGAKPPEPASRTAKATTAAPPRRVIVTQGSASKSDVVTASV